MGLRVGNVKKKGDKKKAGRGSGKKRWRAAGEQRDTGVLQKRFANFRRWVNGCTNGPYNNYPRKKMTWEAL